VDLSGRSLRKLEWNIRLRALGSRIATWKGDVEELPESFGAFDFVVASGLIHHFPDPAKGLHSLTKRAGARGVFRLMVYSKWGRSLLYGAKALAAQLGVRTPAEFRRMIDTLPADHPYRVYFYLYSDARTDSGLADGYLHPCDRPFTALGLKDLLANAGIEASAFLHAPSGQPEAANGFALLPEAGGIWERLQVLEALGELQENFRLFARSTKAEPVKATSWEWNEALPEKGRLYSHLLGKELTFDTSMPPSAFSEQARSELAKAFFLLPGGTP
jgi:SAM-dependent methyltransferase